MCVPPRRPQPGSPRLFFQLETPVKEQGRNERENREMLDAKVGDVNQNGSDGEFYQRRQKEAARCWWLTFSHLVLSQSSEGRDGDTELTASGPPRSLRSQTSRLPAQRTPRRTRQKRGYADVRDRWCFGCHTLSASLFRLLGL